MITDEGVFNIEEEENQHKSVSKTPNPMRHDRIVLGLISTNGDENPMTYEESLTNINDGDIDSETQTPIMSDNDNADGMITRTSIEAIEK
eukprot:TRINITY_DN3991_c0_g1_i1.p1 TRINITY_DN3991_c0_g1~~TRINITY_DN3991_c0_g1_i1.p1  ORF type:complete len:105 (-),score=28.40 TRINITY_DN3991_c0_g1_i1:235-504(-)